MPRASKLLLAVTVAAVAAGTAACGSSSGSTEPHGSRTVTTKLTASGCKPSPAKVPAGPVTFQVSNDGASAVSEAELLSGTTIVGEKENLTPGLSGSFSINLQPGRYTVYCPNADQEKWAFEVTGSAGTSGLSPAVQADLERATRSYHDYVVAQVDRLQAATRRFTDAVRAGDAAAAKRLYAPARFHYEEVEPVAESFGGLDARIDARINDVSDTSSWTGFHRIEKVLWQDHTLRGMTRFADRLDADIAELKSKVRTASYQPAQLANGATELLNEVAASKITGEEDRYSHTDLSDFQANLLGSKRAFDLLRPALLKIEPDLAHSVELQYHRVLAALKKYHGSYAGTAFVDYSTVPGSQRKQLTQAVDALAEPLSQVAAKVVG